MRRVAALAVLLALAGCNQAPSAPVAPPRAAPQPMPPPPVSQLDVPIRLPLSLLAQEVEAAIPTELWAIDKPDAVCAQPTRIKLFKTRIKVTPTIRCHIIGNVRRGPIRLSGRGDHLQLLMPVEAVAQARDIGGLIAHETATASADVLADVQLGMAPDGHLTSRILLDYRWRETPSLTILGQRIDLAGKAEPRLAEVIARAERELPQRLARLPVRRELEALWQHGFATAEINHQRPPGYLRLEPVALAVGRINVADEHIQLPARLDARATVHLGTRPPAPAVTPLPAIGSATGTGGRFSLHLPVEAEYATLEPVIARALAKVAARGIMLPDHGRVAVQFGRPTLYATGNGRLALGLALSVRGPRKLLDSKGIVWLTARPETQAGSERVLMRDVQLVAQPGDDLQFPLLVAVAGSDAVRGALETALAQDFGRDYAKLLGRIDTALEQVKLGPFRLAARLDRVEHGKVLALGQGLHLPVSASGSARLDYAAGPQARPR